MLKISTDIFSASVKKPHNTPLPPPIATVLAKRFIRSRTNQESSQMRVAASLGYTRYGSGGKNRIGSVPFQGLAAPVA